VEARIDGRAYSNVAVVKSLVHTKIMYAMEELKVVDAIEIFMVMLSMEIDINYTQHGMERIKDVITKIIQHIKTMAEEAYQYQVNLAVSLYG
jgi:secreted Zn-dependent insulinase-like peptidase